MNDKTRQLFNKVFSRYVSTGFIFVLDILLSFISALVLLFIVRYLVSNSLSSSSIEYWNSFGKVWLIGTTVSAALMFWLFKSYRIIIRHSSLSDVFRFGLAVLCAPGLGPFGLVMIVICEQESGVSLGRSTDNLFIKIVGVSPDSDPFRGR